MSKLSIKTGNFEFSAEGTDKFVEKHFSAFKKEFLGNARTPKRIPDSPEGGQKIEDVGAGLSLLNLYREKNPSTHYDKIAVFGYYLSKNQNKETFTDKDIEECYKEFRKCSGA